MILLTLLLIVVYLLLLIASQLHPKAIQYSSYELKRLVALNDIDAIEALDSQLNQGIASSLQSIVVALLLIGFTLGSIVRFGWTGGVLLSCIVAITYGAVSRLEIIAQMARRMAPHHDSRTRAFIKKFPRTSAALRYPSPSVEHDIQVHSVEELEYLINSSEGVVPDKIKSSIRHILHADKQRLNAVMTPVSEIKSVKRKELLGPLVLDDLHKTGYHLFPVIDADINTIIGILETKHMVTLDIKRSITAEKAMDKSVFYIHVDQSLNAALEAFLQTKSSLLVVINQNQETVGLLSLRKTINALTGWQTTTSFNEYDNKQAVVSHTNDTRSSNYS